MVLNQFKQSKTNSNTFEPEAASVSPRTRLFDTTTIKCLFWERIFPNEMEKTGEKFWKKKHLEKTFPGGKKILKKKVFEKILKKVFSGKKFSKTFLKKNSEKTFPREKFWKKILKKFFPGKKIFQKEILPFKMVPESECFEDESNHEDSCSEEESMSEDETPTTSDEEFIVSDEEEEDEVEDLIEENENLKKENEVLKNELKKQSEIIWKFLGN